MINVELQTNKATRADMEKFLSNLFEEFMLRSEGGEVKLVHLSSFEVGQMRERFEQFMFCSVSAIKLDSIDREVFHRYKDFETTTTGMPNRMVYPIIGSLTGE